MNSAYPRYYESQNQIVEPLNLEVEPNIFTTDIRFLASKRSKAPSSVLIKLRGQTRSIGQFIPNSWVPVVGESWRNWRPCKLVHLAIIKGSVNGFGKFKSNILPSW